MFDTAQLRRIEDLRDLCQERGRDITGLTYQGQPVDGGRLLLALAGMESNFGALREFVRAEKAYAPGGIYYNKSPELRQMYRRWGALATASYGTFQIMYPTAVELGFKGHPIHLQENAVCSYWATRLIVDRFQKKYRVQTLEDTLDCYNSGYHRDRNVPEAYIKKGLMFYENLPGM